MPLSDRAKVGLTSFIRRVVGLDILGPRMDYLAMYPCRVVFQNADGTLELQPDDARLPGYSKVPIRYGVPGVTATVANGARALLEFAGADPQKPIATVWESASVTQLIITASAIKLGGSGATQALVKGTQYAADANSLATAATNLATALTTLGSNMVAALPAANAAAAATACTAAATAATSIASAATSLASDISAQNTTL